MLSPEAYLSHIRAESARFLEVLADCDPTARVPGCPDWNAADLLWHLTEVQDFWSFVVTHRPAPPAEYAEPERPGSYQQLLDTFRATTARFVALLEQADPADAAWSWAPEQTVGFTFRRQAHEALIHRVDAEQTAGLASEIDPRFAADGAAECLSVMYGGCPDWGVFSPLPHHVRFDLTDVDDQIWVQIGHFDGTDPDGVEHHEEGLQVVADPGVEPDAVVEAGAAELDLRLWKRGPGDHFGIAGDRDMVDRVRQILHRPIN